MRRKALTVVELEEVGAKILLYWKGRPIGLIDSLDNETFIPESMPDNRVEKMLEEILDKVRSWDQAGRIWSPRQGPQPGR